MDIYSQTHVGNVRIDNEDTVYISGRKAPLLAMVADGMGGQAGGRTASENAVSYITTELKDKLKKADVEDLKKAAISAGEKIYNIAKKHEEFKNMGTTLAAAIIREDRVSAINVGDSRIYLLNAQGLSRITKDHKYVQYLVDKGFLTQEEAEHHPYRNIITRALGMEEVEADTFDFAWGTGDVLLICSDGLYEEVPEDEIKAILKSKTSAKNKAETLIGLALKNGGRDNISAIVAINDGILGTVIKNRFEISALIAEGGMSKVYRAYDKKEKKSVAVKVLKTEFNSNKQIVEGFLHEGETTSRLVHKNIVRTIDYGTKNGCRYIVMDYVEGSTLADLMRTRRLTIDECVSISKKIISALSYAHHRGVIHKDLKPHNILLGLDGEPFVTDFGIAEEVGMKGKNDGDKVVGSVNYFSPEQATGEKVGPATDIYSMGIMLYEMCTGKLPFVAEDKLSVALMHLHTPPIPPKEINPDLPDSLNKIILKAIEKKPEKRYSSAAAMGRDIARCLADKSGAYVKIVKDDKEKKKKLSKRKLFISIAASIAFVCAAAWGVVALVEQANASRTLYMPYLMDKTEEAAINTLNEYKIGLNIEVTYEKGIAIEDGTVIAQSPEAGTALQEGAHVVVTVCKYTEDRPIMPDLSGMSQEQAISALKKLGVQESSIVCSQTNYYDKQNGTVASQYPEMGEEILDNTAIILYINRIFVYEQGKVPEISGLDIEDALLGLMDYYRFKNVFVYAKYDEKAEYGTVYSQSPAAREEYREDDTLRIYAYDLKPANYESSFKVPWVVVSSANRENKNKLTVTADMTYMDISTEFAVFESDLSYEELRKMNFVATDISLYMDKSADGNRLNLKYYLNDEEITSAAVLLKEIDSEKE